jgi:nickel/cobalt exporter
MWLLLPTAVGLGALHAIEPGHSKSMMAAFIVTVHGSAAQAVLLAVAATSPIRWSFGSWR